MWWWFGGNFLIVIPLQVRRLCFAMPRFVAILRLMFGQDRLYKYLLQYVKTCDLICLYIVFKNNNNIDSLSGCGFATVTVIAVVISLPFHCGGTSNASDLSCPSGLRDFLFEASPDKYLIDNQ